MLSLLQRSLILFQTISTIYCLHHQTKSKDVKYSDSKVALNNFLENVREAKSDLRWIQRMANQQENSRPNQMRLDRKNRQNFELDMVRSNFNRRKLYGFDQMDNTAQKFNYENHPVLERSIKKDMTKELKSMLKSGTPISESIGSADQLSLRRNPQHEVPFDVGGHNLPLSQNRLNEYNSEASLNRHQRHLVSQDSVNDYDNGMTGMIPVRGADRGKTDETYFTYKRGESNQEVPQQKIDKRESSEDNYDEEDENEESYDEENERGGVGNEEDEESDQEYDNYDDSELENDSASAVEEEYDDDMTDNSEAELHRSFRSSADRNGRKVDKKNSHNASFVPNSPQSFDKDLIKQIQSDAELILTNFSNNIRALQRNSPHMIGNHPGSLMEKNENHNASRLIDLIQMNEHIIHNLKRLTKNEKPPSKRLEKSQFSRNPGDKKTMVPQGIGKLKRDSDKETHSYNTPAFANTIMNKIRNIDNEVIVKKNEKPVQLDEDSGKVMVPRTVCSDPINSNRSDRERDNCGKLKINHLPCRDSFDDADLRVWKLINETLKTPSTLNTKVHISERSPLGLPCSPPPPIITEYRCNNKCVQIPNRMLNPYAQPTVPPIVVMTHQLNQDNVDVVKRSKFYKHDEPNIPESYRTKEPPSTLKTEDVPLDDTALEKSIAKLITKNSEKDLKESENLAKDDNIVEANSKEFWNTANFVGDFTNNNEISDTAMKDPRLFHLWDAKIESKESVLNEPVSKLNSLIQLDKVISETATISTMNNNMFDSGENHYFSGQNPNFLPNPNFANKYGRKESISDIQRRYPVAAAYPPGQSKFFVKHPNLYGVSSHPDLDSNYNKFLYNPQINRFKGPADVVPNMLPQNTNFNTKNDLNFQPSNLTNQIFHPGESVPQSISHTIVTPGTVQLPLVPSKLSSQTNELIQKTNLNNQFSSSNNDVSAEKASIKSSNFAPNTKLQAFANLNPSQSVTKLKETPAKSQNFEKRNEDSIKFRKALVEHAKKNAKILQMQRENFNSDPKPENFHFLKSVPIYPYSNIPKTSYQLKQNVVSLKSKLHHKFTDTVQKNSKFDVGDTNESEAPENSENFESTLNRNANMVEPSGEVPNHFMVLNESQGTFYKLGDISNGKSSVMIKQNKEMDPALILGYGKTGLTSPYNKNDIVINPPVFFSYRHQATEDPTVGQVINITDIKPMSFDANFKTVTFHKPDNPTNFKIQLMITPDGEKKYRRETDSTKDKVNDDSESEELEDPEDSEYQQVSSYDYENNEDYSNEHNGANLVRSRRLQSIENPPSNFSDTNETSTNLTTFIVPSRNSTAKIDSLNQTLLRPKRDLGHFLGMDEDESYQDEASNDYKPPKNAYDEESYNSLDDDLNEKKEPEKVNIENSETKNSKLLAETNTDYDSDVEESHSLETPSKRIKHHNKKHRVFYSDPTKKKMPWSTEKRSSPDQIEESEPKNRHNRVSRRDKAQKDALNKELIESIIKKTKELLNSKKITDQAELTILQHQEEVNEGLNPSSIEYNPGLKHAEDTNLQKKTIPLKGVEKVNQMPDSTNDNPYDLGTQVTGVLGSQSRTKKKVVTSTKEGLNKLGRASKEDQKKIEGKLANVEDSKKVLSKRDTSSSQGKIFHGKGSFFDFGSANRRRNVPPLHRSFFFKRHPHRIKRRQRQYFLKHRLGHTRNSLENRFREKKRRALRRQRKSPRHHANMNLSPKMFDYNDVQQKYDDNQKVVRRSTNGDKKNSQGEVKLEKPHLGDSLATDIKVKSYTEEKQLEEAMTGHLAHRIVESVFHHVEKSNKLKFAIGTGLFREKNHNESSVMHTDATMNAIKTNEKMLHDVLVMLNKVVEEQIKIRTCIKLNHDKQCFLAWLTSHASAACVGYSPFGKVEQIKSKDQEIFPKPPTNTESTAPENFNPFMVNIPSKTEISNEEIRQRIEIIEKLLSEYNALPSKEKSKVKSIHKILTKHLELLLKLQKSKEDSELEDIGNNLSKDHLVMSKPYESSLDSTFVIPGPVNAVTDKEEHNKLVEKNLEMLGLGPEGPNKPYGFPLLPQIDNATGLPRSISAGSNVVMKNAAVHNSNLQSPVFGSEKYRRLVRTAEYYRKKREIENQRNSQFERYKKELMKSNGVDDAGSAEKGGKGENGLVGIGFEEPPVLSVN